MSKQFYGRLLYNICKAINPLKDCNVQALSLWKSLWSLSSGRYLHKLEINVIMTFSDGSRATVAGAASPEGLARGVQTAAAAAPAQHARPRLCRPRPRPYVARAQPHHQEWLVFLVARMTLLYTKCS